MKIDVRCIRTILTSSTVSYILLSTSGSGNIVFLVARAFHTGSTTSTTAFVSSNIVSTTIRGRGRIQSTSRFWMTTPYILSSSLSSSSPSPSLDKAQSLPLQENYDVRGTDQEQQQQQLSYYVGLQSSYDPMKYGQYIPIDERYIPSALLEWGYPPLTLETLVAESIDDEPPQQLLSEQQQQQQQQQQREEEVTIGHHGTMSDMSKSSLTSLLLHRNDSTTNFIEAATVTIQTVLSPNDNGDDDDTNTTSALNDDTATLTTTRAKHHYSSLQRTIHTILPATGCDNDNLEQIKSFETRENGKKVTSNDSFVTLYMYDAKQIPSNNRNSSRENKKTENPTIGIETCWKWCPSSFANRNNGNQYKSNDSNRQNDDVEHDVYRIRVNMELHLRQQYGVDEDDDIVDDNTTNTYWELRSPIYMYLERVLSVTNSFSNDSNAQKSSTTTNMGSPSTMIYDFINGYGGLDSRTVLKWLGPILHRDSIRNYPKTFFNENIEKEVVIANDTKFNDNENTNVKQIIHLPFDIQIQSYTVTKTHGYDSWNVDRNDNYRVDDEAQEERFQIIQISQRQQEEPASDSLRNPIISNEGHSLNSSSTKLISIKIPFYSQGDLTQRNDTM